MVCGLAVLSPTADTQTKVRRDFGLRELHREQSAGARTVENGHREELVEFVGPQQTRLPLHASGSGGGSKVRSAPPFRGGCS